MAGGCGFYGIPLPKLLPGSFASPERRTLCSTTNKARTTRGMTSQGQMALRRKALLPKAETGLVVMGVQSTRAALRQQCPGNDLANPARTVA